MKAKNKKPYQIVREHQAYGSGLYPLTLLHENLVDFHAAPGVFYFMQ
jgi:hypothetical protein